MLLEDARELPNKNKSKEVQKCFFFLRKNNEIANYKARIEENSYSLNS